MYLAHYRQYRRPKPPTSSRLYRIWYTIRRRCYEPAFAAYPWYGAIGVTVCDEWLRSFKSFHDWALANGYADALTIDRIDRFGNYEPANCRWATMAEQGSNKRNNRSVMRSDGKMYVTISDAARDIGGSSGAIVNVCQGKRDTHKQYGWRYTDVNP